MLKLLAKKGKSNKGFTLIELIVVIAIIAILALLLVPRFAGFTEDARVANDRNACETIERAFMTLIANGTLRADPDEAPVTITIPEVEATDWTVTDLQVSDPSGGWAQITAAEAEEAIERLTGNLEIQAATRHDGWTVTVESTGEVECIMINTP